MERAEIKINLTAKSLPMLIKSASLATIISMTTMALINALAPRPILQDPSGNILIEKTNAVRANLVTMKRELVYPCDVWIPETWTMTI